MDDRKVFKQDKDDERIDYYTSISLEYRFEKPAIEKLIQEYLEIDIILFFIETENDNKAMTCTSSQQIQTPTRTIQHYQSAPSFYYAPITSGSDSNDFQHHASTPLLCQVAISSYQDIPIVDRFVRHFGKVQPDLLWTSPLPVRPRIFSMRPPSLSCKIFLGGIPHDLNPRDLQECLESFELVRLEWPNMDNMPMHRYSSNITIGFAYTIYETEESIHETLHICSTKTDRSLDDGRCEYYLDVYNQRTISPRKNSNDFVEDSQWLPEGNSYGSWKQRLDSNECLNRTVFVGALHGMMTAYAVARICHELFEDIEYAALDTDRKIT
ncbi:unnamed protein product [Rotaria sordida]|uniref:RRM domain-containing protein n=3 Tax=Rotaria sordida TaxID=392033 RepID=A0A818WBM7_9BILA|nr:unnamed protein product [Rotaria sordida]